MTSKAFIKKYAVLTYCALVFALSWGGVLIVVGPTGFPGTSAQVERLMPCPDPYASGDSRRAPLDV